MKRASRGAFLLEAAVAGALVAVLLTITLRLLGIAAIERRAAEKRAIAIEEVAGAVERARALDWEETTQDRLAKISVSPALPNLLPGAKLSWSLETSADGPPAKIVRAELTWNGPTAGTTPARLSYWVFAPAAGPSGGAP
jgi:hypothetical protein